MRVCATRPTTPCSADSTRRIEDASWLIGGECIDIPTSEAGVALHRGKNPAAEDVKHGQGDARPYALSVLEVAALRAARVC